MKRKLLMVEDNVHLSEVVVDTLDLIGFDVTAVQSGAEALHLAQLHEFHGALIDLELGPGLSAVEVARGLRELDPKMPIVFSTGYDISQVAVPHDLPVLPKPYRAHDLAAHFQRDVSAA